MYDELKIINDETQTINSSNHTMNGVVKQYANRSQTII